jgi:hypothetical protein
MKSKKKNLKKKLGAPTPRKASENPPAAEARNGQATVPA